MCDPPSAEGDGSDEIELEVLACVVEFSVAPCVLLEVVESPELPGIVVGTCVLLNFKEVDALLDVLAEFVEFPVAPSVL